MSKLKLDNKNKLWQMHALGNRFFIYDKSQSDKSQGDKSQGDKSQNQEKTFNYHEAIKFFTKFKYDQFIVLLKNNNYEMIIYNRDLTKAEICGNATRCIALLLHKKNQLNTDVLIKSSGRELIIKSNCQDANNNIYTVNMGKPTFKWDEIPLSENYYDTRAIDLYVGPYDNPVLKLPSVLAIGNPHCIFFVNNIKNYDLTKIGSMLEYHPLFPQRANISLVEHIDKSNIKINVWERGVGITQSCGSAACAAVVAGARLDKNYRQANVFLTGGKLTINWDKNDEVWQAGSANIIKAINSYDDLNNINWE